jgi:predicted transcriptional regulator
MAKQQLFSEQLRRLILEAGESQYSIAKATGIPKDVLYRFINGKRGLSMKRLDTLAAYLGWIVTAKRK